MPPSAANSRSPDMSPGSILEGGPMSAGVNRANRTGKPIIQLRSVHKSFGNLHVLAGVDLDIPEGKTTVVLGPSGSGKSVMLKHIVGLLRPDKGEIFFDGQRIDNLKERDFTDVRLQVGLLFQGGALFDSLTVEENIEFPLREHTKLSREERHERVGKALEVVDLKGMFKKLPVQLSGGQRKRVALARAIVLQPRVVLYDEPTTGLDPIRSDGINELIIKLSKNMGVTSIVVTHDLVSARKVADRCVMLLHGKIAADGTYDELARHENQQVSHFFMGQYDQEYEKD
ncbi:MAG: ABC transporter ATP-binding protein [Phycisphaerales bacterium]|nr:ABC transporter ATP-binding protein [Phycisphaerales bacterium]